MKRRTFVLGGAAALSAGLGAWYGTRGLAAGGSSPVTTDEIGDQVQTLPRDGTPEFARAPEVAVLYRYAVDHGDELRYIPCFCGCGRFGHTGNRDCYIKAENPDGTVVFTSHAAT